MCAGRATPVFTVSGHAAIRAAGALAEAAQALILT